MTDKLFTTRERFILSEAENYLDLSRNLDLFRGRPHDKLPKWGFKAELDSIKPKEIYKNQKIKKKISLGKN